MAVWLWIYNLFVMSAECLLLLFLFFLSLFRENHGWSLIPSQRLPSVALQNLTPAPCPRTTPPSPTLHSRLPQVLTPPPSPLTITLITVLRKRTWWWVCPVVVVCVYLNKYGKVGPHLDQRRIQQLPDHFGPGRASSVLQQCVQACVDSAHSQSTVFSCLKPGQGGEVISGRTHCLLVVLLWLIPLKIPSNTMILSKKKTAIINISLWCEVIH